jgi:YD repeat-containing protein
MNRLWKLERWLDREAPTPDDWMATVYQHDDEGRVTQITDPENHSTYFTFDAAGRRTQRQDHLGNKVTYGYASDCCSATEIEEVEKKPGTGTETFRTELVLDPLNRVTQRRIVDRDNSTNKHTWSMVYSSLGVVEVQKRRGGQGVLLSRWAWQIDSTGGAPRKWPQNGYDSHVRQERSANPGH